MKLIVYEVEKNRWVRLKNPQWYLDGIMKGCLPNTHGYQLNTVAQGRFFRAHGHCAGVSACNIDKDRIEDVDPRKDWESVSSTPSAGLGCLEYFPDRKSLLYFGAANGELYEKPLDSPTWTLVGKYWPHLACCGVALIYNPVHKTVVYGGGAMWGGTYYHHWYKLDAEGKATPIDDCPLVTYAHNATLFTVDPVSGKYLLIQTMGASPVMPANGEETATRYAFYELDITAKPGSQWKKRKDLEPAVPQFCPSAPFRCTSSVVVPLPEYGVNLFMGLKTTWIYKHSEPKKK